MSWFWWDRLTFEEVEGLVTNCKEEVLDEVEKLGREMRNLRYLLAHMYKKETKIIADIKELAEILQEVKDRLDKATVEIVKKINDLVEALANTEIPADAMAVIEGLKAAAAALDEIVPDPAPEPTLQPVVLLP